MSTRTGYTKVYMPSIKVIYAATLCAKNWVQNNNYSNLNGSITLVFILYINMIIQ